DGLRPLDVRERRRSVQDLSRSAQVRRDREWRCTDTSTHSSPPVRRDRRRVFFGGMTRRSRISPPNGVAELLHINPSLSQPIAPRHVTAPRHPKSPRASPWPGRKQCPRLVAVQLRNAVVVALSDDVQVTRTKTSLPDYGARAPKLIGHRAKQSLLRVSASQHQRHSARPRVVVKRGVLIGQAEPVQIEARTPPAGSRHPPEYAVALEVDPSVFRENVASGQTGSDPVNEPKLHSAFPP